MKTITVQARELLIGDVLYMQGQPLREITNIVNVNGRTSDIIKHVWVMCGGADKHYKIDEEVQIITRRLVNFK
jgi:hypothetical protein